MAEQVYDRVNDYGSVKITLASPNDIRSWSFGEVKKPETINYRTYRPEKDGLFCERIFGPERDYECACGKYKGTKFKGIICDRCGVKVTHSRVRRKRMGHINLAAPIVHIWFFKAIPSHLGNLLGMKTGDIEKVIYFQDYAVVDPGDSPLKEKQVLTEDEYRQAVEKYGSGFKAMMGAEAAKELLTRLDLHKLAEELRANLRETRSKQKIKDLSKRLKIVEQIRKSENKPEWMVMDVVPVIPPDLRPLVLLESGNFATSDLNDLYRRIINRNNRLKKLMDLNAPEVIIRNEKRMLQQSVDALFDNGRCRRPVLGSSNRPLKSLTDMIKGKQGRFRENLLGKRVDYSARSVIVVGPELKLHQCGLPKKIALELYQPFIIRKLKEHGLVDTIKSAKKMLERRDPEVWDILEEVIYQHPVLLNRAPTLHRMGIQAFEPVLVEGNAIKIHPLVCTGFNADFDGDQMAVHLPLSVEAQAEAHILMLSTHNIFSPAHGNPIISPSQDIVLGVYYLTAMPEGPADQAKLKKFKDPVEAGLAYDARKVSIHEPIIVRLPKGRYSGVADDQKGPSKPIPETGRLVTTMGRLIFNDILDPGMPFYNCALGKKGCSRVIDDTYDFKGRPATIDLLDRMKEVGFKRSTLAGLSFGITDLRIPAKKHDIIADTQKKVDRVQKAYEAGAITDRERYNQLLDLWTHCRELVTKELLSELKHDRRDAEGEPVPVDSKQGKLYLNPVWLMSDSGARGNVSQIQQLAGMRGLMSKPSGEIIETPIKANAREGMNVLEYFSSTHGARKGLADTALKTADSGYLTRKLADVAQNVSVATHDCGTKAGVTKRALYKGEEIDVPLREAIIGRTARETIRNPITDELIVAENQLIDDEGAEKIEALGVDQVMVRSPLSCEARQGICALCYGQDMSTGKLVEQGLAVGIIAAQSIGEPGTQLTMRTFHTGGIGQRILEKSDERAQHAGTVAIRDASEVPTKDEDGNDVLVALKRNGEIVVNDAKGRELEKYKLRYGAYIHARPGQEVKRGQVLVKWDPHREPILAEKAGKVRFEDIIVGETVRPEQEGAQAAGKKKTGLGTALVVIEHKGERHPRLVIEDQAGKILDFHYLPAKARIEVAEGEVIEAGQMLARQPREAKGSSDIVGGLPRVTEIFEARKPKEAAIMAEISGTVELRSDRRRGKMTIIVRSMAGDAGITSEDRTTQDDIVSAIKAYGRKNCKPFFDVKNDEAKKLVKTNPFALCVATLAMRLMSTPYEGLLQLRDRCGGDLTPEAVANLELTDIKECFAGLADQSKAIQKFAKAVKEDYSGDVRKLLKAKSPQELAAWLDSLPGVGLKISRLLPNLLFLDRFYELSEDEQRQLDVGPDVWVAQAFRVLNFADVPEGDPDEAAQREIINTARRLNPEYPGDLDFPMWLIGNKLGKKATREAYLEELGYKGRDNAAPVSSGLEKEHHVPQDRHLLVHTGDYVEAGDPLIDGPLVPHDILRIKGEEALYSYLLDEVQNVYRAQGVPINDKHVEIILTQMLRKLRVEGPGDSELLPNEVVDKFRFREANERVNELARVKEPGDTGLEPAALVARQEIREANAKAEADGKAKASATKAKPATAKTLLLGITKASLQSESFLSGASFQETTKVLTEAALAGRVDKLVGLKENVLLGHLIPVGTGFKRYSQMRVIKLVEPPAQEAPSREEEIEDAAARAEAAGAEAPDQIQTTVGESRLVAQLLGEQLEARPNGDAAKE